ncbi:unnamed protein product [Ostreobium quekettii]|uniref:Uncharacterized protein n=1 Tax=Ostreobium quekettii TaxID=121088 RepID=A0A8S1IPA2_9CHLO|nr:unnamed protein product [Ostreobium quekettii]
MADFLNKISFPYYAKVKEMGGGDEHGYLGGDDVSGWVAGYISERTIEKLHRRGFQPDGIPDEQLGMGARAWNSHQGARQGLHRHLMGVDWSFGVSVDMGPGVRW